jgi:hypothetical protein
MQINLGLFFFILNIFIVPSLFLFSVSFEFYFYSFLGLPKYISQNKILHCVVAPFFFLVRNFAKMQGKTYYGCNPPKASFWKIMRRIAEKRKFSNQLEIRMTSKQTCNRK